MPSLVDPDREIRAEVSSRRVEDDGSFPESVPVHILCLTISSTSAPVSADRNAAGGLPADEATAWRNHLLPQAGECYVLEDPERPPDTMPPVWYFVVFLPQLAGPAIAAPQDFDWVAHRVRYRGLRVSLLDRDGTRIATVYENPRFPKFYLPYTEGRGTYWTIQVSEPPEHARIGRCFDSVAKAIARRGAIATDIRPLALTWKQDSTAELLLRDESTQRCHRIELTIPTDDDLASGTYLLPGGLGGPPTRLTDPIQYAAGEIARLRDYGRSGIELWGQDTHCP